MTPIKINDREYYFEKVSSGEFSEHKFFSFYIKGEPNRIEIKKRKYLFFGPVIDIEVVYKDNYIYCFESSYIKDDIFPLEEVKVNEISYYDQALLYSGKFEI